MTKNWDESNLSKKTDENASLWAALPGDLKNQVALLVLSDQRKRKMNRISGHLKKNVVPQSTETKSLAASIDNMILGPYGLLRSWCHAAEPNEQQFYLNNQLFAALLVSDADKTITDHYAGLLSEQWKKRNHSPEVVVIAHRGDGATYEKVRKVFERKLFDHLYKHENENSKGAVLKALDAWRDKKLHGVECDVWFTKDNHPIVTHTQHVDDLLRQEGKDNTHHQTIGEIKLGKLSSRFLTLEDWLQIADDYVRRYKNSIEDNHNLRLEIEMKDTALAYTASSSNKQDVLTKWREVERVVSRFLKRCERPSLYQIALFNGSDAPSGARDKVREDMKTMLQDVVYGGSPKKPLLEDLREVRYGLHSRDLIKRMARGEFAGKILTFAPGVEAFPQKHPEQLKTLGEWIETPEALTVEQAIQCARLRRILNLNDTLPPEKQPLRIQVLTDFGSAGADFIVKHKALAIGAISAGQFDARILDCVFKHYKIEDATKRRALELELGQTGGRSQEKLIEFGQKFLKAISDWA